jgi:hydrogenase expression/formation protein HypC
MCLAIPGQILTIETPTDPWNRTGRVLFGTIEKTINLAYAPDAGVGDYVLVHVGFALQRIDPDEAVRIWEILREMEELHDLAETSNPAPEATS